MSDTAIDSVDGGNGQGAAPAVPPLVLSTQYVRDLVFRVPGAPGIYAIQNLRPHVTLNLDVQVRRAQEGHPVWEVTLLMGLSATTHAPVEGQEPPPAAFAVELAYSGIFTLQNVAQHIVEPMLFAECPRLLFPFARAVLADITREAGFPPVMLQPIDFVAFWQGKRAATQAAQAVAAPAA
jgi:preprotein translocase subunit SecB